jgi:pilus assembly protein CpaE
MNDNGHANGRNSQPPISEDEQDFQGKEKILLIDDDPGILRMLGLTLKRFGYTVTTAKDGQEGLAKAESFQPDLIILDIMMPDLSGLEVSRRLRANPKTAHVPILMLSAKAGDIDKAAGFQAGADDYLAKPVGVKALLSRVEGVLLRARYAVQKSGVTIALLGAKGGVGVTSLAINLGAALAVQQKNVTVAELREARGTLHHFLHLTTHQHIGSLLSMDSGQLTADEVTRRLVRYAPGFNLMLSPPGHSALALTADHVETLTHLMTLKSDYLLLDLPTPPPASVVPALEKASYIFLLTEPEPISLACSQTTLKMLDEWGLTNQVRVVTVTRSPGASMISQGDIQHKMGDVPVVGTIPPATEMMQDAARLGKSLVEAKPHTLPAQAYTNLANWLINQEEGAGKTKRITAV